MALATEDLVTGVLVSLLKEGKTPVSKLHEHEELKGKISRATVFRRIAAIRAKKAASTVDEGAIAS